MWGHTGVILGSGGYDRSNGESHINRRHHLTKELASRFSSPGQDVESEKHPLNP